MKIYGQRQERIKNKRIIYQEDTGIVCASRAYLWREGRRIGDNVKIIVEDEDYINLDIHTEFDLFLAEKIFDWYQKNGKHDELP